MKKKIVYYVIYSLVLALMLASEVFAAYCVLRLDMLPMLYVVIFLCLLALLLAGVAALLFIHRAGRKVGIARQIIACILAAVVIGGCVFVSPKLLELRSTVEQITTNAPVGSTRNVYVQRDDPAQTIRDTSGYTFAALTRDAHCTEQVVAALEKELQTAVSVQEFDDESLMITAYYNNEVNALILNEGYLSVWEENELYAGFADKNRIVYTVQVEENNEADQTVSTPEPEPVQDITNTPFIVYLSGMDGYSEKLTTTRSDVNILMVVNPNTKQILLINTPRDYYVVHPWGYGTRDKLTHCGIYGIDCSIAALELLYNIPVNYYVQINFSGFESLIDGIGGITVYSDSSFYADEGVYICEGENNLDGKGALHFSRDRYHQAGGDNGRGQNQMKVLKAVISKITSARTFIANYSNILSSLEGMLATNMPLTDLNKLVKMQLGDMAKWDVLTYAVTGSGGSDVTYSMPYTNAYVTYVNQATVDYGTELANRILAGELLTQEDMEMPK